MMRLIITLCALLIAQFALTIAAHANASYSNTTAFAIDSGNGCPSVTTRTIAVGDNFLIADVDLGLLVTHTWRGDVRLDLISPQGTRVRLIESDTDALSTDNYNVLLSDQAPAAINNPDHAAASDSTTAPPFENRVRPDSPLSAFNGESSLGSWQLELCDDEPGSQDGQFQLATLFLSPQPSPPKPTLSCNGSAIDTLQWTAPSGDTGWPNGSIAPQSYTVSGADFDMSIGGATDRFIGGNGEMTPVTSLNVSGGTNVHALALGVDFISTAQLVTLTMDLGDPGVGLDGLQFDMYDIDAAPDSWQDRLAVDASLDGAPVPITLTPTDGAGYVDGNALIGIANVPTNGPGGEGTVTVNQPLDRLVITYTAGPNSPDDPSGQVIGISALNFCPVPSPSLVATKTLTVGGGGFAIPGSDITYTIAVENRTTAGAPASDIRLSDVLADELIFLSASASGFSGGGFAPALPATNTDCGGGACVVSYDGATLPVGASGNLVITARLK